jgi:hypothetical protein
MARHGWVAVCAPAQARGSALAPVLADTLPWLTLPATQVLTGAAWRPSRLTAA